MVSPGLSGGASADPIVISTSLSPSRPCVTMRASEFRGTRSAKRRANVRVTCTLPPGSGGSSTFVTRPICTPASRTVAPSISPPTSVNSAVRAYLRRSEEHTSELQSQSNLVCRLLLEKKKKKEEHILKIKNKKKIRFKK